MKKGFTLIELLAVILILGIIALIAIPTVNNILKESRRGAFQSTITNIEKAIEQKCTTEQIKNQEITSTYTITEGVISPSLDIKGELPDGVIYVNNECAVSLTLSDNNFTGTKDYEGELVITDGSSEPSMYVEGILNGADPVLSANLIPVTIKNDGTVKEADLNSKWYSYAEKKWANAVILKENGKIEEDGTILEDSIESYFVWIPRFKYKLFDMGNYNSLINGQPSEFINKTIEIVFENKNTPVSVGTDVNDYHSHPAFQAFDTNGFWVGKFETTGSTTNQQIKPNQTAIGNLNVKTIFELSYNYKRTNDSHMMKNTEWGAVAYLTLSKYGLGKDVNPNNNTNFITGYSLVEGATSSGTDSSVTLPYNTETGYLASTTGNITGIYDLAGGINEYVAGFLSDNLGSSGFIEDPTITYGTKYFDKYPSNSTVTNYSNSILGDGIKEFGPFYYYKDPNDITGSEGPHNAWFGSYSFFIEPDCPWLVRGGAASNIHSSGILEFYNLFGFELSLIGYRIVLAN